jgi:hypothetical protein
MKFPTYIILDVQKLNEKNNSEYWAFSYLNLLEDLPHFYENFYLSTKLFHLKRVKSLKLDLSKFSLTYRSVNKNPKPIIKSINTNSNNSLLYKNNKL